MALFYQFITKGIVFSGSGDGFRQMMPFQMYLYEHFTSLKGFYDASFGLGGDYVKSLAYYYSLTISIDVDQLLHDMDIRTNYQCESS